MVSDSFLSGFIKAAEQNPEGHHLRRALLGNPVSSAIEAEEGKKGKAFGNAFGHHFLQTLKGTALGGAGGAGLGALASLATKGRVGAGQGAAVGGVAGSVLGSSVGSLFGAHGREASRLHGEHSKHRKD